MSEVERSEPASPVSAVGSTAAPSEEGASSSVGGGEAGVGNGMGSGVKVSLPSFEGPLDLLLHLCQKHELDILDIPIGFITEKYLEFLAVMQLINLDVASEYLVMAATLAHIKSKMLLPAPPPGQEDEVAAEEEDPREALIRRLLEYQKYKLAGEQLQARGVAGRDVFLRGMPIDVAVHTGLPPLAQIPLFALVEAFQNVLTKSKVKLSHDVVHERITLTDRINELVDVLRTKKRVAFEELFEQAHTRFDLVITFLALLEMTRLRMTRLYQADYDSNVYIEFSAQVTSDEDDDESVAKAPAADVEQASGIADPDPTRGTEEKEEPASFAFDARESSTSTDDTPAPRRKRARRPGDAADLAADTDLATESEAADGSDGETEAPPIDPPPDADLASADSEIADVAETNLVSAESEVAEVAETNLTSADSEVPHVEVAAAPIHHAPDVHLAAAESEVAESEVADVAAGGAASIEEGTSQPVESAGEVPQIAVETGGGRTRSAFVWLDEPRKSVDGRPGEGDEDSSLSSGLGDVKSEPTS